MRVGVYLPPEGYLAEVRDICREHDILFVVDEVVTGFGRIGGEWFASTRFDLQPDMMTTAKGLTSGYVPMGAVFIAPRVAERSMRVRGGVMVTRTAGMPVLLRRRWRTWTFSSVRICSRSRSVWSVVAYASAAVGGASAGGGGS